MAHGKTKLFWETVWAWYLANDSNITKTCENFRLTRPTFYKYFRDKLDIVPELKRGSETQIQKPVDTIEVLSAWYTERSIALEKARINNLIAMNETFQILTKRINEDIKIHGKTNINHRLYETIANIIANKKQININYTDNSLSLNDNRAVNNLQNNNNLNNQNGNTQLSGRDALMKALASDEDDLDSVDEVRPVIELNNNIDNSSNIIEESQIINGSEPITDTTENTN